MFGSSSNVRDLEHLLNEPNKQQKKVEVLVVKDQIVELKNCFRDRFQTMMARCIKQFILSLINSIFKVVFIANNVSCCVVSD